MALSLCSARTSIAVGRPGTSRRTRPVVRSVGEDMLKIFSKPNDAPPGLGSEWSGAVTHHDAKRRPFNEGGKAKGTKIAGSASAGAAQVPQEPEEQSNEVMDYVGGALESVVGNNFVNDGEEPPAGSGSAGWKGDIHDRKRDGFHARKV